MGLYDCRDFMKNISKNEDIDTKIRDAVSAVDKQAEKAIVKYTNVGGAYETSYGLTIYNWGVETPDEFYTDMNFYNDSAWKNFISELYQSLLTDCSK